MNENEKVAKLLAEHYQKGREEERESLREILKRFYNKCLECYNTVKKEQMKQDFHQRMDEIVLIYSSVFDLSCNESKEELFVKQEGEQ